MFHIKTPSGQVCIMLDEVNPVDRAIREPILGCARGYHQYNIVEVLTSGYYLYKDLDISYTNKMLDKFIEKIQKKLTEVYPEIKICFGQIGNDGAFGYYLSWEGK